MRKKATLFNDIKIININGRIYFRTDLRTVSIIDLAFISRFENIDWFNWCYLDRLGSDYEIITFECNER